MVWTPIDALPGYETENGKLRSISRQLRVVFRQPRVLGYSSADDIITHPHDEPEERDSMGAIIPPSRNIGATFVNVMDFGAAANGVTDDTDAWQAAIDSLPTDGGTVYGPNGDYLIDAERSINLRSKLRILRDINCRLLAKPTDNDVYAILRAELVNDIEIDGGQTIGERDAHLGTGGEQGHGILILGCARVTVMNLVTRDCWGDGIKIGGARGNKVQSTDWIVSNVLSQNNRRQGISLTNQNHGKIYNSDFLDTNGTAPQCGMDIEPNAETTTGGTAEDLYVENTRFKGNASSGVHIQRRTFRVTWKDCEFTDNDRSGLEATEVHTMVVDGCTAARNGGVGIKASSESSDVTVKNSIFGKNSGKTTDRSPPLLNKDGAVSGTKGDLTINAKSPVVLTNNDYL